MQLDVALKQQPKDLKILLISSKFNSMAQRVSLELHHRGHAAYTSEPETGKDMESLFNLLNPDLVICPYLTKRIPETIWKSVPCLIVHPGIEGDRGMHSLDWALRNGEDQWGVTVLEASDEMDAGDIWATKKFNVLRDDISTLTKSSLYGNEVTDAAASAVLHAVDNYAMGVVPKPLDYSCHVVKGRLRRKMVFDDRVIDWAQPASDVARQIRMSDSQPGAIAQLRTNAYDQSMTESFRVFGARLERDHIGQERTDPGRIIGHRDGAILVKCSNGAVWVSQIKKDKLKLPATMWLDEEVNPGRLLPSPSCEIPHGSYPSTFQDIWMTVHDKVCYLNFDFYNGAMSTTQCKRLTKVLNAIRNDDRFNVVCLMGGHNVFSNGIHLNVIEKAEDSALESWRNINAINDVVKAIFTMNNKITVSALQGNAGAGGCMMALACDMVWARTGIVLNPHYKSMHLFGSEYHTYFFHDRVGEDVAMEMAASMQPILAQKGLELGLVDEVMGTSADNFRDCVEEQARKISRMRVLGNILNKKNEERTESWLRELENHREQELEIMKENFNHPDYHEARGNFVYH